MRRTFKLYIFFALCLISIQAANAFFFIIPLPSPNYDPDKINADREQRQWAMCAAYHRKVIDPNLTGSRTSSWHNDVESYSENHLKALKDSKKLITAYAEQWSLQNKGNAESGARWGQMLSSACREISLPVSENEYSTWKASKVDASKPTVSDQRTIATSDDKTPKQSVDPIFDQAILRCKTVGYKPETADFRTCVLEQTRLLTPSSSSTVASASTTNAATAQPQKQKVIRAPKLDMSKSPSPASFYPPSARKALAEGSAVVRACVDSNGKVVGDPTIGTSSLNSSLDDAAIMWSRMAVFNAGTIDGVPSTVCTYFKVNFKLTDPDPPSEVSGSAASPQ